MIKNNFINSLKYMNEETIIYHIKYGNHSLIEIQILKKRLNDINNKKNQENRIILLLNKISYLENIIKNQQNEINNLKIKNQQNEINNLTKDNTNNLNNKLDRIKFLINKNYLNS